MSYRSKFDAAEDRANLERMRTALNAANSAMRLDECRLCIVRGSRGYVSTWGDGRTWMLAVSPAITALKWTWVKRRLAAPEPGADSAGRPSYAMCRPRHLNAIATNSRPPGSADAGHPAADGGWRRFMSDEPILAAEGGDAARARAARPRGALRSDPKIHSTVVAPVGTALPQPAGATWRTR